MLLVEVVMVEGVGALFSSSKGLDGVLLRSSCGSAVGGCEGGGVSS